MQTAVQHGTGNYIGSGRPPIKSVDEVSDVGDPYEEQEEEGPQIDADIYIDIDDDGDGYPYESAIDEEE